MALILESACSTRPRHFVAQLDNDPADVAVFQKVQENCRVLALQGRRSGFGDAAAQTLGGTAAGYAAGSAAVGVTTSASFATGLSVVTAAMTFVGPLAGFGVSRAIRSGREKRLKRAMTACLDENGYSVASWDKTKRPPQPTKALAAAPSPSPASVEPLAASQPPQ
jgi:hypothetical protein